MIKKVALNLDEEKKYEIIKRLLEDNGNKDRAAMELGVTKRHINRMINGYKSHGKAYFIHGNRGRKPATTIPADDRATILDLYRTKYYDANFTHFTELLECFEGIQLSPSTVASILEADFILSPRATRAKKKRLKKLLVDKQKAAPSKKEADKIRSNLISIENAHSRRPRCAYFGELLQMDASQHKWFGNLVSHLHIAVDDATGCITGAWFDCQETLEGYYHVFHQILSQYGIPYKFFTDRRTVFTYKQKATASLEEDTYTQFAYACKSLGVGIEVSSVPQAKGRVERMFQTLQSRLPVEMRLAGITDLDAANVFLNSYIKKYNAQFALPHDNIKSVFETQPDEEKINLTLAILTERKVDSGHCVRFNKAYYRMLDGRGMPVHYLKGTSVMVIQAYNKQLYCCVNDKDIYVLECIPSHEAKSKELDADYKKPEPQKRYIPPMNHPWRRALFNTFANSQPHRCGLLA